jgi:hypothetical protein
MCGIAFVAVFVLLSFLAAVMALITVLFPEEEAKIGAEVVAVISSAVASVVPGAKIIRIEESS